jgi:cytochrome P450
MVFLGGIDQCIYPHFELMHSGYTIPEGSKIMICPSAAHLNSKVYEDPLAFNPWRWKVCEMHI